MRRITKGPLQQILKTFLVIVLCLAIPLTACNTPSWVNTAVADLPIVLGIVTQILPLAGVSAATTDQVTKAVNLALSLYKQYKATPATTTLDQINAALAVSQADIQEIISALQIQDPNTRNMIVASLAIAIATVEAIASNLPAPAPMAGKRMARVAQPVPSPKTLRNAYEAITKAGGHPELVLR